uniref:ATP-dependent translocase ABCB1-like isoform X2 n=1 Tax=Myxine glutinosa TaxID=7769 RepID=UPI00358EA8DA
MENGRFDGVNNPAYEDCEKEGVRFGPFKRKNKKEKTFTVGFFHLFRYSNCLDKFLMVLGLLAAIAHGLAHPIVIMVFGDMTDSFVKTAFVTANGTSAVPVSDANSPTIDIEGEMSRFALYFVAIAISVLVAGTIQVSTWLFTATRQTRRIHAKYFHAILHQDMSWFDAQKIGELSTRMSEDINVIHDGIGDKISLLAQVLATFVGGIVIGFFHGWKLTLVILAVSPLIAISLAVLTKFLASLTKEELKSYAKAGAVAEEVLSAIRTVVAFGGQKKAIDKYKANLVEAKNKGIKKAIVANLCLGLFQLLIFASYALAFWYGTKLVIDEPQNYTIGRILIVFFSVLIGTISLAQGGPKLRNISQAQGAAYEVYKTIEKERLIDSSCDEGYRPDSIQGDLAFENIDFTYPARPDVQVLKGLNLLVPSGKTIALVGSSGCGKSTTIQLLQRFYDPGNGKISVDGRDIRSLNVRWLRENIGVVSQEPILFATTVAENIRYGRPNVTLHEMEQAAREANAYDFIMALPDEFETMVGERGAQLSGGQKQRIAIARALVRNPRILLLDEATSALDTESEAIVQSALDKARKGRTTIVIAHRLSTVRTADLIAGFVDGAIGERGTHDELMARGGVYCQLVNQQTVNRTDKQEKVEPDDEDIEEDEEQPIIEELDIVDIHPGALVRKLSRKLSTRLASSARGKRKKSTKRVKSQTDEQEKDDLPKISFWKILAWNKPEVVFIVFGLFAAILNGGVPPAFGFFFGKIIGVFGKTDSDARRADTALYSAMFLILGVISFFAFFLQGYMFGKSGEHLTMRLRGQVFKAMLRQEISWFDDHRHGVGVLTTRLATDASQVQGASGVQMGLALQTLASLATGIILAFIHGWQLTLLVLAMIPVIAVSTFIQFRTLSGHVGKSKDALEEAGKVATEAVANIRTVVSLTREQVFYDLYMSKLSVIYRQNLRSSPVNGLSYGFSQCTIFFIDAAIFRFGAWLIANGHTTFENFFIVFAALIFSAMMVGQNSSMVPDYAKAKESAGRILKLMQTVPSIDSSSTAGQTPTECHGEVEFQDICFHYPTRPGVSVLDKLNVVVHKGQTLALVGASGCGKSTLTQLLERFYDPLNGAVRLDGKALPELQVSWLRAQLGVVFQEPILFDCSITENIAYGDNDRVVEQAEIEIAAHAANIHNFINELPQGYETNVGDKGAQLSGGQKQRIAIARALVRNPHVLLLDEATSALDTESEKIVQEALDKAREGRTSILIAHRLSTIQNADKIAVIQHGRVVEQGSHHELLARREAYYALVNAQVTH